MIRITFLSLLVFSTLAVSEPATPPKIDGFYRGEISILETGTKIPVSTTLTMTGETTTVPVAPGVFEEAKVIDGAVLLDEEGGPYPFSKITYRLEKSEIDMRYNRTEGKGVETPASFRLIGKVDVKGTISGRVMSGFKGNVGSFTMKPEAPKPMLAKDKYVGLWIGAVKILPEGDIERASIQIGTTGFASVNPPQLEFDFTRGKVAHFEFNTAKMEFRHVSVDYLRRRIIMTDSNSSGVGGSLMVEAEIDFEKGRMNGYFSSVFGGRRGEFSLRLVK